MLRLVITDSGGERRFATERSEILLGRRRGVDLRIDDAAASRNHCLVRVEGDHVRVVDLGSANGTFVGDRTIEQALLGPGHEFRVGGVRVRVESFGGPVGAGAAAGAAAGAPGASGPASGGRAGDFGREVRELVRRAPWYGISLVVHVALLLLLDLIPFTDAAGEPAGRLEATAPPNEMLPDDVELDEPDLGEIAPVLEAEPDVAPDDLPSPTPAEFPEDALPSPSEAGPPETLGIDRGNRLFKVERLMKSPIKGASDQLRKGALDVEHGLAHDEVQKRLGAGIRSTRGRVGRSDILVVKGDFDKIELVLDQYGWPNTLVDRDALLRRKYPGTKLLFINCARRPPLTERRKLVSIVKAFVRAGGWVVTSDWAVEPYLTDAFPEHLALVDQKRHQPDTKVEVQPVSSSPLLEGVFNRRVASKWWLEETSTMVDVKGDTEVLVESRQMERLYGARVVVCRFDHGRGRVLHLLGHFYQKDGNRMGLVGMHMLINNVILERFRIDH